MIGTTVSHYRILEKPRHKDGGQVGEGGMSQNFLRTLSVSSRNFEDPRLPLLVQKGGQAPSFWRRRRQ